MGVYEERVCKECGNVWIIRWYSSSYKTFAVTCSCGSSLASIPGNAIVTLKTTEDA